jgi:hypothetical protein
MYEHSCVHPHGTSCIVLWNEKGASQAQVGLGALKGVARRRALATFPRHHESEG